MNVWTMLDTFLGFSRNSFEKRHVAAPFLQGSPQTRPGNVLTIRKEGRALQDLKTFGKFKSFRYKTAKNFTIKCKVKEKV